MIDKDIHQVHVQTDFAADGLSVWIFLNTSMDRRILRPDGRNFSWDVITPGTNVEPSFTLSDGHARALMSTLLEHYNGTPDSNTQRQDLMHERQRRDVLEDTLIRLVQPRQTQFISAGGAGLGGQGGTHSATSGGPG